MVEELAAKDHFGGMLFDARLVRMTDDRSDEEREGDAFTYATNTENLCRTDLYPSKPRATWWVRKYNFRTFSPKKHGTICGRPFDSNKYMQSSEIHAS